MAHFDLNIFSLNANGLGNKIKRKAVFEKLKSKGNGIFLLQETHTTKDREKEWFSQWGSRNIYFSHGSSNQKGVATLVSDGYDIEILQTYTDCEGRCVIIDIKRNDTIFTVCNVYAPTRDKENEQISLFKLICTEIMNFNREHTILGGDFNLYMNQRLDKLDTMPDTNDNAIYRQEILSFLDTNNMIDIWRAINPSKRTFTWYRGKQRSRLDYFFTSEHLLNCVQHVDILPGIHSDHSLLKATFDTGDENSRGRGLWKFNSTLLRDTEYVANIKRIIKETGHIYDYMQDKGLIWELIKLHVRSYTIQYTSRKKKEMNEYEKKLNYEYNKLHDLINSGNQNQDIMDQFSITKSELEKIECHRARGAMLRSKVQWIEDGEKNTSYFLRLERQNYCNKLITQLNVDDEIITDKKQILMAEKAFYEKLYSDNIMYDNDILEESIDEFTKNSAIPKLNEEQKQKCEEEITESEILKSIKALKCGKSPGTDGLTSEFYKFFWGDIKTFLMASINFGIQTGQLSVEQRRGIITLIPKKDKNRLYLKNWRPITLLNIDYKILAKILAHRLVEVLPTVISEDQTGYIKGRYIGCNIRLIEDMIFYTNLNDIPGIMLTIDFEKAFDSIKWSFIDKSLQTFNFGLNFRNMVKTLYSNISTAVINNGSISEWFSPEKGVRQGCPVSPYLFIMSVELLAVAIRENKDIKGIVVNEGEIKLSQLADDMTCFTRDLNSVAVIIQVFRKFEICAGLKVNVEKTTAKYLGSLKNSVESPFGLNWSGNSMQSLGVTFSENEDNHYENNFQLKIKNLRNLLNSWKGRHLSLKGKVTVINNLALSPLVYLASNIYVPHKVFSEVKSIILNFLWDGGSSKIAYEVIIQEIKDGGLGLIDFEEKEKALKINWIKRITDGSNARWKLAPSYFYKCNDLTFFFQCNQNVMNDTKLRMYGSIQKYWVDLNKLSELNCDVLRHQILWNNQYITIENKPIYWSKWKQHGINTLNDILDDKGLCLNHIEINRKFNVNCNFLSALQIRQSIPITWRETLKSSKACDMIDGCNIEVSSKVKALNSVQGKIIYFKYIHKRKRSPTCVDKWTEEYPGFATADPELWQCIFKLPYSTVRETRLQSLQYRIIHRTITCNKKLYDMKLLPSPKCSFCDEIDTLRHFFLFCPKVVNFWNSFFKWWNNLGDIVLLDIPDECILFGYQWENDDLFKVLNFCILNAKHYIHKQKLFNNNNFDLYDFLIILKFKLQLEKSVCENKGIDKQFEKFLFIYEQL